MMAIGQLSARQLVQAIRIFFSHAYPGGEPPEDRRQFLQWSEDQPVEQLLAVKGVERLPKTLPDQPAGLALRVGNAWYRHMKITIQPVDASPGFVLGVDTHDDLRLPANSPESEQFKQIQQQNQALARAVEQEWESQGLPTQAVILRQYLNQGAATDACPSVTPQESTG